MSWLPIGLSILLGMLFSQQPVINTAVSRILGSPVAAAACSVFVTLVCLLILLPFSGGSLRPSLLAALPWWSLLGGMIGVGIVAGAAALAPITGAALFFVCLVGGQLMGAALADHFGAFGLPLRSLSWTRLAGLGLVFVGALLVHRG
ncbi:DMT family transporter [Granulosicoccus sp. 3-233]|uniref:DMT family transporter n=1 Tax=Granulosicoccus sp. 3-233 TaxID=3417969 RepID=UPI003D32D9A2